jgi:adenosylhomocysteine nucleosidase
VKTWLAVAAEGREFDGVIKRMGGSSAISWPGVKFARQAEWKGRRWWMIANGPGAELVKQALTEKKQVDGILSTGLCGGLDPALRVGDIVVSGDSALESPARFVRGAVHTADRVIGTAREKRILRNQTGAVAVDMEAATVAAEAAERHVPFLCIRVVSDAAGDTLPLDFNHYRNRRGDFSRSRIALAAVAHPFTVLPQLMEFDRNCRRAADSLGDFLADCRF